MTARVRIKESGNTPYLPGELVRLSLIKELIIALKNYQTKNLFQAPKYEPTFFSTINVSLEADGFLSAAGFQETKSVLMKAAIQGRTDWLRGLKECIIVGRMIPAGSSFLNYKDNLDTIYFFKKKKLQKEERTAKESLSFS
jgi:DNA-directed RNA polymerase subunit beta'